MQRTRRAAATKASKCFTLAAPSDSDDDSEDKLVIVQENGKNYDSDSSDTTSAESERLLPKSKRKKTAQACRSSKSSSSSGLKSSAECPSVSRKVAVDIIDPDEPHAIDENPFDVLLKPVGNGENVDYSWWWVFYPDLKHNPERLVDYSDPDLCLLVDVRSSFRWNGVVKSCEIFPAIRPRILIRRVKLNLSLSAEENLKNMKRWGHIYREFEYVYVKDLPHGKTGNVSEKDHAEEIEKHKKSESAYYDLLDQVSKLHPDEEFYSVDMETFHGYYTADDPSNIHWSAYQDSRPFGDDPMPNLFRYYVEKNAERTALYVYVKLSALREMMAKNPVAKLPERLTSIYRFLETFPEPERSLFIPDSFGSPEMQPPPGFKLELRSYQKRTLHWLCDLESSESACSITFSRRKLASEEEQKHFDRKGYLCVQIGPNGPLINVPLQKVTKRDYLLFWPADEKTIETRGAILADEVGTGKTVTVLALIHSQPFQSVAQFTLTAADAANYLISRATLIVCPSHLAGQWKSEALRCMPNCKVVLITTIMDHGKISWNDVLLADIVIISLSFLQNKNYDYRVKELMHKKMTTNPGYYLRMQGPRIEWGKTKGEVILEAIWFYRLVCDEFHEMETKSNKVARGIAKQFLSKLHARFYLGVTGTPAYQFPTSVARMAEFLRTDLPDDHYAAQAFLTQRVRRNDPNLRLPPLIQRLIWVEMSIAERALYQTGRERLMACNHYHLAQEIVEIAGDQTDLSLEEVAAKVQQNRLDSIQKNEKALGILEKTLASSHKELRELPNDDEEPAEERRLQRKIDSLVSDIENARRIVAETWAQYNFFETMVSAMMKLEEEQTCLICLEDLEEGLKIAIAECGHVYCAACAEQLMAVSHRSCCPMCRMPINAEKISMLTLSRPALVDPDEKNDEKNAKMETEQDDEGKANGQKSKHPAVDYSKYGSKLAKFVEFMNETLEENADAKFILFIQFRRLTLLVSKALRECNIDHVVCQGNVMQRAKAIREFKQSKSIRLILLSSEDSASGLHLVEATHVIIMHPFSISGNDIAMAFEKQGIARAWRGGQDHQVQVVRFLVRDSIEEEMANMRNYKEGDISADF